MSVRAAQMAKLIMEEWKPHEESAESFAVSHFAKDTLKDLEHALKIVAEIEDAELA